MSIRSLAHHAGELRHLLPAARESGGTLAAAVGIDMDGFGVLLDEVEHVRS